MLREQAKEIIAHWLYQDRKFASLLEYGSAHNDQIQAEKILRFFEGEKELYGFEYIQDREDFERFRHIYDLIDRREDAREDTE